MGRVFRAKQLSVDREVALKVIKAGSFASAEEVRRFQVEAKATAALDHPNIVPIFEVGEYDGQPFFSMKLVDGGNVATSIRRGQWWVSESAATAGECLRELERRAATLVSKVALAVHHAHQRNVLHRDLKPSNILLDSSGEPYVTDFGLAKLLTEGVATSVTASGVGTPAYMAPEQVKGGATVITKATDVYGLGAVLYELLTGKVPAPGNDPVEVMRRVLHEEPRRPRSMNPAINKDLETVCLKCLEKEPRSRYSSALDLAEDLQDWLAGRPIAARPANLAERGWKWIRRNPKLTGVALVIGTLLGSWLGRELVGAATNRRANRELRLVNADSALGEGRTQEGLNAFRELLTAMPSDETATARAGSALAYRPWAKHVRTLRGPRGGINALELSPDRRWWASASAQGVVEFFPRHTTTPAQGAHVHHQTPVLDKLSFAPSSDTVIASGSSREFSVIRLHGDRWDVALTHTMTNAITWMQALAGDRVIVADDQGTITLLSLDGPKVSWSRSVHPWQVTAATLSANNDLIASGDLSGRVRVLRLSDGETQGELSCVSQADVGVNALAFDSQADRLLIAVEADVVGDWSWRSSSGVELHPIPSPARKLVAAADGRWVAGSLDGRIFTLGGRGASWVHADLGTRPGGPTMMLRSEGDLVAQLNANGEVQLFDRAKQVGLVEPIPLRSNSQTLSLDARAGELATASADGTIDLWQWNASGTADLGVVHRRLGRTNVNCVAVSADDHWQASGGDDGIVWLRFRGTAPQDRELVISRPVQSLAFLEAPPRLLIGCHTGQCAIVDLVKPDASPVPFGPTNGIWSFGTIAHLGAVATVSRPESNADPDHAELWNLATGSLIASLAVPGDPMPRVERIAVSRRGSSIIGINPDRLLWWNGNRPVMSGDAKEFSAIDGVGQQPTCCALSMDGDMALVGTLDGILSWWSQGQAQPWFAVEMAPINSVIWSPISQVGYAGLADGTVLQVELQRPPRLVGRLNGTVTDLAVSPDGALLAAATSTGRLKVWNTQDRLPVSELFSLGAQVFRLAFTADSSRLLAACNDGSTREYRIRWPAQDVLHQLLSIAAPRSVPSRSP